MTFNRDYSFICDAQYGIRMEDDALNSAIDSTLGGTDGTQGTQTDATGGQQQTDGGDNAGQQQQQQVDQQTGGRTTGDQGGQQQQQGRQQQQGKPGSQQSQQRQAGNPGDLRDAQGNVLARAGQERRFFEGMHAARREVTNLQQQLQTTTTQLNAFREANGAMQQLGLQPDQAVMGMRLMASYIKNPKEAIKYILTEAQAAGHNLQDILGGGTIDMSAIDKLLTTKLQPVLQGYEQQQLTARAEQQAERVWTDFTSRYSDAPIHENELVALMQADPTLSLDGAYFALQSWAVKQGLDFSQPLHAQWQAKNGQQDGSPADTGRGLPPTGGRGGYQPRTAVPRQPGRAASETMASRDIVAETMREAGYNI